MERKKTYKELREEELAAKKKKDEVRFFREINFTKVLQFLNHFFREIKWQSSNLLKNQHCYLFKNYII